LFVYCVEKSPVTITTFSVQGKQVSTQYHAMEAGTHTVPLPRSAAGLQIYKIVSGREVIVLKECTIGERAPSRLVSTQGMASDDGTAKLAATPAFSDMLTVEKNGYLSYFMDLVKADTNGIEIKLAEANLPLFSFFVTSLQSLQQLSGSQNGFGGDLRFGETGPGAGLRGADKICATIAEISMPGSSAKQWRAFLSVSADQYGRLVNAIDRIGKGPWYDRMGRMLAPTKADLLYHRPQKGDPAIRNDFPNEFGIPNHQPDPTKPKVDNHHMITGSDMKGMLYSADATCEDWTSIRVGSFARCGLSWPRILMENDPSGFNSNWISAFDAPGCGPGVQIAKRSGTPPVGPSIGIAGGYGGFYCFALNP
jgi:hypothetical protein